MTGLSRITGRPIGGVDLLRQSIEDVLTTPIGTRVLRRDYGSDLPSRIDAPLNGATIADVYADVAQALDAHIADFQLDRVQIIDASGTGRFSFRLDARHPLLDAPLEVSVNLGGGA
jgi:phage baseplate assembly protein W